MNSMRSARGADVAIIGGGVIGTSTALELARRGASVVVLERGRELAWGCSAGNAGIVGASHVVPLANLAAVRDGVRWMTRPDSPFFVRPRPAVVPWLTRFAAASMPQRVRRSTAVLRELALSSVELHKELDAAGLDASYRRRGLLDVFRGKRAYEAAQAQAQSAETLTAEELAETAPQLSRDFAGGILHRDEMHCDPLRFVLATGAWATELGTDIRNGVEVLGVRRHGDRVQSLWTTRGDISVGTVVVATGVWSPELARDFGARLPIEGGKGYHVDLEAREGDPELPIWLHESRVVITPLGARVRLAGTLELTGTDDAVDARRVRAITDAVGRALPAFHERGATHVWRGLRPCTPDGLPVIDRAPELENVFLATGHGMWGLQLAPVTAQLVAALATGETPAHDLHPLRADRFERRRSRAPRHLADSTS
jgi:D-amino-acid dehydrogenase